MSSSRSLLVILSKDPEESISNAVITRFRIESIISILLLASVSASFIQHRYPDYDYSYEDELVEVVFYLRNHAEPNSNILREDFDSAVIFRVLYDMDIKKYEVNESSSYEDLKLEIFERDIDYLIYSRDFTVVFTLASSRLPRVFREENTITNRA